MSDIGTKWHVGLGLSLTAAQEQFSKAFILATASLAGCSVTEPKPDDDSIDWTLSCRLAPRRPKLDLQVKSTSDGTGTEAAIRYPVKPKNYDELILANLLTPRLLVVVMVPPDPLAWLTASPEALVLRHCTNWVSLRGLPPTDNETSVTVQVPRANRFDINAPNRADAGGEYCRPHPALRQRCGRGLCANRRSQVPRPLLDLAGRRADCRDRRVARRRNRNTERGGFRWMRHLGARPMGGIGAFAVAFERRTRGKPLRMVGGPLRGSLEAGDDVIRGAQRQ